MWRLALTRLSGFNPRRPVSRPATHCRAGLRAAGPVSIHADRFPGRRPGEAPAHQDLRDVSIHADRFPGRRHRARMQPARIRPVSIHADRFPGRRHAVLIAAAEGGEFQSMPTGFPAGDADQPAHGNAPRCFNPRRPVSRPATPQAGPLRAGRLGFNPRRPVSRPATPSRRRRMREQASFNPRRPVSRPATAPSCRSCCARPVSIHADRFPGRRLNQPSSSPTSQRFQSTPTGFPAGDTNEAWK